MRYLLSPRVLGLGVILVLGGVSAVTARGGSVVGGALLVVLGALLTGACVRANITHFTAVKQRVAGPGPERSPYRNRPEVMAGFRRTAYVILAAAGAAFGAAIWLVLPGTSQDAFLVVFARILAIGFLPLLWNGLLVVGAFGTFRGLDVPTRRNIVWLRVQWVLALVVVADAVLTRPTANWAVVAGSSAVVALTSLAADGYTRRFVRGLPGPAGAPDASAPPAAG